MTNSKRGKARPLLLAAATAVTLTLTLSGCEDDIGTSGNLLAPNCDMYPAACGRDLSVPDLTQAPDLAPNADLGDTD